eukprot:191875_1
MYALFLICLCWISIDHVNCQDIIDIKDGFDYIIDGIPTQTVRGQITVEPYGLQDLMITDTGYGFAIQDDTGGIWVYVDNTTFYDSDSLNDLTLGRWVTVSGVINTANGATDRDLGGLVRITPNSWDDVVIGDDDDPVEPTEIEVGDVNATQGLLVKLEDVKVTHLLKDVMWGKDYRVVDESNDSVSIWYFPSATEWIEEGEEYEYIIGYSGIFIQINASHILEREWEIWPRSSDDWKLKEESKTNKLYFMLNIIICLISTLSL